MTSTPISLKLFRRQEDGWAGKYRIDKPSLSLHAYIHEELKGFMDPIHYPTDSWTSMAPDSPSHDVPRVYLQGHLERTKDSFVGSVPCFFNLKGILESLAIWHDKDCLLLDTGPPNGVKANEKLRKRRWGFKDFARPAMSTCHGSHRTIMSWHHMATWGVGPNFSIRPKTVTKAIK